MHPQSAISYHIIKGQITFLILKPNQPCQITESKHLPHGHKYFYVV